MLDGALQLEPAEWGVMGLGLSTFVLIVVLTRINMRARAQERELMRERASRLIDIDFLDQLASAAPPESVADLFTAMAQDCRGCIDDIREAAKMTEFDRVQEECAALAESCDAFGATGLAAHAQKLKVAIAEREFGDAGRLMVEIDSVADKTFRAITRQLKDSARRRAKAG